MTDEQLSEEIARLKREVASSLQAERDAIELQSAGVAPPSSAPARETLADRLRELQRSKRTKRNIGRYGV